MPCLPSQNPPIDFLKASSAKDLAHHRSKEDHDRSKHVLSQLLPGQHVQLQDAKSAAWDHTGVIVSVRPDKLSYVINVHNGFFTRPRLLLRPIATPSSSDSSTVLPSTH